MSVRSIHPSFVGENAEHYDRRFTELAPMRESLHMLARAVLSELPVQARILCVGAGTGAELIDLAEHFAGWQFTAVEPSSAMLDIARRKAEAAGIGSRCEFHLGYLDSLPASAPFDAATAILVSQFCLRREERRRFFREIAERLVAEGRLISADLASGTSDDGFESLLSIWLQLMRHTGMAPAAAEALRAALGRDVAVAPVQEIEDVIASSGFRRPVLFLQAGLIHAWCTRRAPVT